MIKLIFFINSCNIIDPFLIDSDQESVVVLNVPVVWCGRDCGHISESCQPEDQHHDVIIFMQTSTS